MRQLGKPIVKSTPEEILNRMLENIDGYVNIIKLAVEEAKSEYDNDSDVYNYVMQNENGLVKIGISKQIDIRQKTLEHASGYNIVKVFYIKSKRKAHIVESELHEIFSEYRKLGEWFELSFKEAVATTKKLSVIEAYDDEDKNLDENTYILNRLSLFGMTGKNDEDVLDYYVIYNVLEQHDIKTLTNLLEIYTGRYIETGVEAYNLFSLYLLTKAKSEYGLDNIVFECGNECSKFGRTVYLYEKEHDFCECLDFYHSIANK